MDTRPVILHLGLTPKEISDSGVDLTTNPSNNNQEWAVQLKLVKAEKESDHTVESSLINSCSELYKDHEIKEEIVIGPTVLSGSSQLDDETIDSQFLNNVENHAPKVISDTRKQRRRPLKVNKKNKEPYNLKGIGKEDCSKISKEIQQSQSKKSQKYNDLNKIIENDEEIDFVPISAPVLFVQHNDKNIVREFAQNKSFTKNLVKEPNDSFQNMPPKRFSSIREKLIKMLDDDDVQDMPSEENSLHESKGDIKNKPSKSISNSSNKRQTKLTAYVQSISHKDNESNSKIQNMSLETNITKQCDTITQNKRYESVSNKANEKKITPTANVRNVSSKKYVVKKSCSSIKNTSSKLVSNTIKKPKEIVVSHYLVKGSTSSGRNTTPKSDVRNTNVNSGEKVKKDKENDPPNIIDKEEMASQKSRILTDVERGKKKLYSCDTCSKQFTIKSKLKKHKKSHHNEIDGTIILSDNEETVSKNDINSLQTGECKRLLSCDICFKKFTFKSNLLRHKGMYHSEIDRKVTCSDCGKSFNRKDSLKLHINLYHNGDKRYQCDCGIKFNDPSNFNRHKNFFCQKSPQSKSSFTCNCCKKTFPNKHILQQHLKHKQKKYICDYCQQGFAQKLDIVVHIEKHMGLNTLTCAICKTTLTSLRGLQKHMVWHSGKTYKCNYCEKIFRSSSGRSYHKKVCIYKNIQ